MGRRHQRQEQRREHHEGERRTLDGDAVTQGAASDLPEHGREQHEARGSAGHRLRVPPEDTDAEIPLQVRREEGERAPEDQPGPDRRGVDQQ